MAAPAIAAKLAAKYGKKYAKKYAPKIIVAVVVASLVLPAFFIQFLFGGAEAAASGSCGAVGGGSYTPSKVAGANTSISKIIYSVGRARGVSAEIMRAAFIVAYVETEPGPRNQASRAYPESLTYPHDYVTGGDGRSVGIYQQQVGGSGKDGKPWGTIKEMMDPAHAAGRFFDVAILAEKKGITNYADIAHFVQVSAAPQKYKDPEKMQAAFGQLALAAREGADTNTGETQGGVTKTNNGSAWVLPLAGNPTMTSPFGPRGGRNHNGVDYAAQVGSGVLAINAGKVIRAGPQNPNNLGAGWGNVIFIDHGDQITSVYAHLSVFRVNVGDVVASGQVIGLSGNTGRSSGPHLHLETWIKNGTEVDPVNFLNSQGAISAPAGEVTCGSVDGSIADPGSGAPGGDQLTPRARNAKLVIENRYGCAALGNVEPCLKAIYGYRNDPGSDHGQGRAIDVMVDLQGRRATGGYEKMGQQTADYVTANAAALGVDYVIWQQKYWSVERPTWKPMEDRGDPNQNHFNHVHISFKQ